MDSQQGGSDLDSFIASDEEEGEAWESDGAGGEGGWRAALREATGGCVLVLVLCMLWLVVGHSTHQ